MQPSPKGAMGDAGAHEEDDCAAEFVRTLLRRTAQNWHETRFFACEFRILTGSILRAFPG
jgi:hypothetical protein